MGYQRSHLMALIREELGRRPASDLAQIARVHRVSASTLRRALATEASNGFRAYRQEIRMESAVAHLRSATPRLIKEISADLGFATPEAFGRWFRRETGVSPSAYRAAHDSLVDGNRPTIDGGTPLAGGHVGRGARSAAAQDTAWRRRR